MILQQAICILMFNESSGQNTIFDFDHHGPPWFNMLNGAKSSVEILDRHFSDWLYLN